MMGSQLSPTFAGTSNAPKLAPIAVTQEDGLSDTRPVLGHFLLATTVGLGWQAPSAPLLPRPVLGYVAP